MDGDGEDGVGLSEEFAFDELFGVEDLGEFRAAVTVYVE